MGNINVKFIDKNYDIPEDILQYIELLKMAESVKEQLIRDFVREVTKSENGLIGDDDMTVSINKQINRFITKLCENGIYDRTVTDYLRNNKGKQLISDVNKAALNKMKSILIREMDEWQSGFESALDKKEASVTGMGFSIWSGSFVNHAIYAAMQASTINKQEKAANREYQKDMDALRSGLDSKYGGERSSYIKNDYIPNMEIALTVFSYELLDKYISDLIEHSIFDKNVLSFVDISRSNELLDNLKLSENKKAILENAFLACPYNTAVYMGAMRYELLDIDTFQTAKAFKCDDTIISFLESHWGEVSYPKKFDINYHCIDLLALYTGKDSKDILRDYTKYYANSIVSAYSKIANMCSNEDLCNKAIRNLSDNELLSGKNVAIGFAQAKVNSIVPDSVWKQLVNSCGHTDLFEKIKGVAPKNIEINTKSDIDSYFIEQLSANFEVAREKLSIIIKNRNAEKEKREKEEAELKERAKQKRKKYIKMLTIITSIVIVIIGVFACLFEFLIIPSGHYKSAVKMYDQGKYEDALDIFQTMQDYKDSHEYIVNCYMFLGDYKSAIAYNDTNTEIVIPNGIKHIKADAFCNAENITSVVIPNSVTVIESNAFNGCASLTKVTIPSSVTHIENGAFDNCDSLVDVHISDLVNWCHIKFEDLTSSPMHYGDNLYLNGELLTEITIPNELTKINEYTFASWDCLVSISIGDNIIDIDSSAFSFCDNLKKVILPNTITNIKESTFDNCDNLVDITIPSKVKNIEEYAFSDCNSLTNIIIPNNVETIGKSAFANCDNLTDFSFPNGIKTISAFMFYPSNSLTVVKIPNSVKKIEEWAFRECPKLSTIEFAGTINEWRSIEKDEEWDIETDGYTICCIDGEISASQNALLECKVGDIITFGSYEQDGNSNNGTEDIEWVVLERKENQALIISQYCIDQKPFNDTFSPVLWANCSLRKWLNGHFYNVAFSKEEQAKIISSNISTEGKNTTDKIFLLSEEEAVKHFDTDYDRKADATEYVSTSHCYWLLRTTGSVSNVAHVDYNGKVGYYENVDRNYWVRPAMWIEISN